MYENVKIAGAAGAIYVYIAAGASPKRKLKHVSEQFVYVLYKQGRTRATRALGTNNRPPAWQLGTLISLSNGSFLGAYKIVGVRDTVEDESAGDIPDTALTYSVM